MPIWLNWHIALVVHDFIRTKKQAQYPRGMGWEGVLYELRERKVTLPKEERYIHTAMEKNGFRLVVTMHPYIVTFIHEILSLNIDYTFKRIDGDMDEWEVAGFLDRFKKHANCRVIVLDREISQAPGLADFFATYNDPSRSNIFSRTPEDMLGSCLITCNIHFER
ncbi:hypothetical protein C8J57DRAFT_1512051 [Mycena rebaudengoi]|nr:hypothetical protein C8J57DRAFT_1512051 [Mycena rebaudengoi]